jgi:hypothetical protein
MLELLPRNSQSSRENAKYSFITGLVTWPFCGQITRFWLFYFLFGLEKNVWPFGSILAFLSSDRNFHYF